MRRVQVLGTGCPKCEKLRENAEEAARLAGVEVLVERISDIGQILAMDVLMTPALVIDGEVRSVGKLLSPQEIAEWLAPQRS